MQLRSVSEKLVSDELAGTCGADGLASSVGVS